MTITEYQDDRGCHVALRGRLDVRTVADLRLTLHRLIATGTTPVLLDLGEAHVGDATGFGFIVECQRRARRAGRPMRIVAADDRTRRLLRRARLHRCSPVPAARRTSRRWPAPRADRPLTRRRAAPCRARWCGHSHRAGRYPGLAPRLAFTACPRAATSPVPSATARG